MSHPASINGFNKGKITLSGAEETLLLTLFARAKDAESLWPVLNDHFALDIVTQIRSQGYDFNRTTAGSEHAKFLISGVNMRARMLDIWTEKFLAKNPGPATVLHLACGLDTRSIRVKWQGEGRLWIDADREAAVKLRQNLMKDPEPGMGEYRLIAPNIHDDSFLRNYNIPTDRPVLILFEGLTPYLTAEEMHSLLRRLVKYFREHEVPGEIRFDVIGSFLRSYVNYWFNPTFKLIGTGLSYHLDDPLTLEQRIPGLRFKERMFGLLQLLALGSHGWFLGLAGWLFDLVGIGSRVGGGYGFEF